MQAEGDDVALLWDMRRGAGEAISFVNGLSFDSFAFEPVIVRAVERTLEVVGEAAGRVSPEFRESHAEIPWRELIDRRDLLAHEYADISVLSLWETVQDELPRLIEALDRLLSPEV